MHLERERRRTRKSNVKMIVPEHIETKENTETKEVDKGQFPLDKYLQRTTWGLHDLKQLGAIRRNRLAVVRAIENDKLRHAPSDTTKELRKTLLSRSWGIFDLKQLQYLRKRANKGVLALEAP